MPPAALNYVNIGCDNINGKKQLTVLPQSAPNGKLIPIDGKQR